MSSEWLLLYDVRVGVFWFEATPQYFHLRLSHLQHIEYIG